MQVFNVVFYYGGEIIRINDNELFYIGDVQTLVSRNHIKKWNIFEPKKLVKGWGYKEGSYRTWTKIE